MDLDSSRYLKNDLLLELAPAVIPERNLVSQTPESDRSRGIVIVGVVLVLLGLLLANCGALQILIAKSPEELAGNRLVQILPAAATPAMKWVIFGLTSSLIAVGMTLIGSQPYLPGLLALHILVPVNILPVLFGYLYRMTCDKFQLATQLWAGLGVFLMTTSMILLMSAIRTGVSDLELMLIAFKFQAAMALVTGSLVVFFRQIREASSGRAEALPQAAPSHPVAV